MDTNEINYKMLRKIQELEKSSPVLSKINSDFYSVLSSYLKNLDKRFNGEGLSPQKSKLLQDELRNIKKIATSIYEQREKKILLAVVSKARGGDPDLDNLVELERTLFESVLQMMNKTREAFLKNETSKEKKIEEIIEEKSMISEEVERVEDSTNPVVMVKSDIPEFMGTDEKKYHLRKGDVLSLPADMSEMLLKRDVVKQMKHNEEG